MSRFPFASTTVAADSTTPRPIVRRLVEGGHEAVRYAGGAFAASTTATGARHAVELLERLAVEQQPVGRASVGVAA